MVGTYLSYCASSKLTSACLEGVLLKHSQAFSIKQYLIDRSFVFVISTPAGVDTNSVWLLATCDRGYVQVQCSAAQMLEIIPNLSKSRTL